MSCHWVTYCKLAAKTCRAPGHGVHYVANPWSSMEFRGIPWNSMDFHGVENFHGTPVPWISMVPAGTRGYPWENVKKKVYLGPGSRAVPDRVPSSIYLLGPKLLFFSGAVPRCNERVVRTSSSWFSTHHQQPSLDCVFTIHCARS